MGEHTPKLAKPKETSKQRMIYKWQAARHHCGICHKPVSNPEVRSTCIPKGHVEVCWGFHETFHYKAKAHECFACQKERELNVERCKDIAKVVAEMNQPPPEEQMGTPGKGKKGMLKKERPRAEITDADWKRVEDVLAKAVFETRFHELDPADALVQRNLGVLRDKKWEPGGKEAALFEGVKAGADAKTLTRHARVRAAFGLELINKGGNAKVHTEQLEKFWTRVTDAKETRKNEVVEYEKRREGFKTEYKGVWELLMPEKKPEEG